MRLPLALAATLVFAASCSPEAEDAVAPKQAVAKVREPLTTVASYDFEGGLSGWTAAATSGTCTWQVLTNPQTLSVSTALNPFSVTLADTGAHLAPPTGSKVIWFGHTANGTFVGNPYPAQSAKNGGSSAAVQTGTITSPVFSLTGATKAQLDFDSWWEIEGTAAASYDLMTVLVSTNGTTFTQLAKLNPSFAAAQPADAAYSSGGPAAPPVWRHYVYDLSAYAGQATVYVRFMFDSRDTSYNAFRSFTVDNVVIGKGNALDAPVITSVDPNIATANDLVSINGSGFLGGAVFTIGTTTITAANITQFGANAVIFKVPTMTAGTYPVKVTNPDGQTFTLANGFTYSSTASPTISSISPATANVNQAQSTIITGSNFVNGATVMIGGTAASSVIWNSATQLTVMVPALAAGTYNVEVTNPSGQSGTKFAAYTVADTSTISLTAPNGGQVWQAGTSQNITWTQSGGSKVNIALYKNGVFVGDIATNVTASAGTYTWAIPATTAAGTDYRVRIYNPAGTTTATSAANFTITASPAIPTTISLTSSVNPSSVGQAVTFTATFSPSSVLGTVTFTVDGATVGSALLVGGNTASSPAISSMSAGSHTITATFVGTLPYNNSSTSITQVVGAAPTANAQSRTTAEDTAMSVTLAATDPDNGTLTYTVLAGPTKGSLSGTPPNLTYTPNANANGSDSFTFKANDGTFDSNTATVSITITPVNDAPVANAASFTVAEDGTLNLTLSGTDVDGDTLTWTTAAPANGTLSGTGATRVYTPNANYFGSDAFTFTVHDGTVSSAAATISITVTPVNDAPVAIASSATTAEDTAVAITLLGSDVDGDALTYIVGSPAHGSLSGAAPNLTYTPAANYFGSDSFTFTVKDATLTSAPATVTIVVTAVNDAPIANAQAVTTAEDTQVTITLTGSDVDGDALSWTVGTPAHGTLSGSAPNLTYTPNANYQGSDSFTFTVNDGSLASAPASVSLTVTSVNDAPVAAAQTVTTAEDTQVSVTLSGSDVDGDAITYQVGAPAHGTLSGTAPNLTYTPNANYEGSDAFTFTVKDASLTSAPATVNVTITAVNDAPVATAGSVTTDEDHAVAITLNATDADGDTLTYTVGAPTHGALSGTAPNLTYTPNTDFNGSDSFTFSVSDGQETSSTVTVSLTITAVNDAPVANAGSATTSEDTAVSITLTGSDLDGDTLTYNAGAPTNGTLSGTGAHRVYTPNANFEGTDSFTFTVSDGQATSAAVTVTIVVSAVNDAPVSTSANVTTAEDNAVAITLSASDVDGDALTYTVGTPAHGSLSGSAPNLTYTPNADFHGSDAFTFTVSDGQTNSNTATVSLTVTPVNDAPIASSANVTTSEDIAVAIALAASDVDGDALTYTVGTPANGTLSGTAPNLTYTPNTDFNGSDSFTFTVSDGQTTSNAATVSIVIKDENDAPVAHPANGTTDEDTAISVTLTAEDLDGDALTWSVGTPAHGSLSGTAPNLTYTPNADFNGSDSLTFTVNDGLVTSNTATFSLTVTPVNDAPLANAQTLNGNEDDSISITLTGSDVENSALSFAIVSQPAHGTLSGSGANRVYAPNANFNGTDSFTFTVSDGQATSAPATVSFHIAGENDAPVSMTGSASTSEDMAVSITLNATDIDNDALTYAIVAPPTRGTLSGTGASRVYTPNANFHGTDTFSFQVNDGELDSNVSTITITVVSVNDVPVAGPATITLDEDTHADFTLLASDADGDQLTYSVVAQPQHGTLTGTLPEVHYVPDADFNGDDTFTFKVSDGTADSDVATISLTVAPINDAPIATAAGVTTDEDEALAITLAATDVDGDALTFTIVDQPAHGTLSGTPPAMTYTPNASFNGSDSFTFKANDGALDSAKATIDIDVTSVNDEPVANAQAVTLAEDATANITLEATDVDGDALTYTVVAQPQHGTLSGTAPNLTYAPNPNFNGSDAFTFEVTDGTLTSAIATVAITVTPVDDAPIVNAVSVSTSEDTAASFTVTGSDVDGDVVTFVIVSPPAHGTISGTAPNFVYTPNADYEGPDSFSFVAVANGVSSQPMQVDVSISAVNDAPVAQAPIITADEDLPAQVTLLAHDADGDTLTYTIVTAPQHGTLTGTAPNLIYTPDANYNGPDSFSFTVSDGSETSAEVVVSFGVTAVNDAPVADAQSLTTSEDEALTLAVSASDMENDALTFAIVRQPMHGTLTGTAPDFTYAPNADFNGDDTFTFKANDGQVDSAEQTIRITVTPVNDAPLALSQRITAHEDTPVNAWVAGSDVDGDALTFTIVQQPMHGSLSGTAPNYTYTPNADFTGADAFTFKVNDGQLDSALGTVAIDVGRSNDAPVARASRATVDEDGEVAITLTADDADGDALTFAVLSQPTHGTLSGSGAELLYAPEPNFFGDDSFTFRANDGQADSQVATIRITVKPVDDAPIAKAQSIGLMQDTATELKLEGEDLEGAALTFTITAAPKFGTLSGEGHNLVYKPALGYAGDDAFEFIVTADGTNSQPATVAISVMKADDSFTGGGVGCSSTGSSSWGWLATIAVVLAALRRRQTRAVALAAVVAAPVLAQEQSLTLPRVDSQALHLNAGAADSLVTQGGLLLNGNTFRASLAAQYEYEPLMFTRNGVQRGAIIGHRASAIATLAYAPFSWLEVNADLPVALYQRGDDLTAYGLATPTTTAFGTSLIQVRGGLLQQRRGNPLDLTIGAGVLLPLGSTMSVTSDAGVGFVPRIGVGRQLFHWLRVGGDVGIGLRPQSTYEGTVINRNAIEAAVVVHTMNLPVNAELSYRLIGSLGGGPIGSELLIGGRGAFARRFEAFAVAGMGLGSGAGTPAFRAIAGVSVSFDFTPAPAPVQPVVVAPEPAVVAPEPKPEPAPVVEAVPAPAPEPVTEAIAEAVAVANEEIKEAMVGTQLFKAGSFTIDASAIPTLDRVAKTVKEGPASQRVRVEGFTDSSGPLELNLSLSKQRAEVVKKALVERGIDAARIDAIGVGPARPIASNDTREGREANRRFEITLVP